MSTRNQNLATSTFKLAFGSLVDKKTAEKVLWKLLDELYDGDEDDVLAALNGAYTEVSGKDFEI